jgi:hypothetical protein
MVEGTPNRPIPEGEQKQNFPEPEPGAGPVGLPPPNSEQIPQGGDSTSPEHQPPEGSDNASKAEEADIPDGHRKEQVPSEVENEDFIFGPHLPMRVRGYLHKGSNSTTREKT